MIHKPNPREDRADEIGCGCISAALVAGVIPGITLVIIDIIGDASNVSPILKVIIIAIYTIIFVIAFIGYIKG